MFGGLCWVDWHLDCQFLVLCLFLGEFWIFTHDTNASRRSFVIKRSPCTRWQILACHVNVMILIALIKASCLACVIYVPFGGFCDACWCSGSLYPSLSDISVQTGPLHSQPSHVEVKEEENAYDAAGKCSAQRSLGTWTPGRHAYTGSAGSQGSGCRCFCKIIQHAHRRRLFVLIIIDGSCLEKHCYVTRFPVYNK